MRLTFLFWNTQQLPIAASVARLAGERGASVVILTESTINPSGMIDAFRAAGLAGFCYVGTPGGTEGDIHIYVRFAPRAVRWVYDDPNNHVAVRRLRLPGESELLLVVVHYQSKRGWSDDDQVQGSFWLASRVAEWESKFGHARTLLVGDLNMNPFEKGVVGAAGLHAVMTREIALGGGRVVDAVRRPFFYNPMWRFFGERAGAPPGTHYYAAAGKPISYYWNVFDQVMVRPGLVERLGSVDVATEIAGQSLLRAGKIESAIGSDHLPLLFDLDT